MYNYILLYITLMSYDYYRNYTKKGIIVIMFPYIIYNLNLYLWNWY